MPGEMTNAEINRAIDRLETQQQSLVTKAVYDRDQAELRSDIREIKDSQKWMMRLLVTQFFGLVVAVVIFAATRGIG